MNLTHNSNSNKNKDNKELSVNLELMHSLQWESAKRDSLVTRKSLPLSLLPSREKGATVAEW